MSLINFRDLGGLPSRYGGILKSHRLVRSGQPHDRAEQIVLPPDLALVVDLRYAGERVRTPVQWPAKYVLETLSHGFERQTEAPHVEAERLGGGREGIRAFYRGMYGTLPLTSPYRDLFGTALQRLPEAGGGVLIHCTAGKDRTGMFVALALHALGVEREAIMEDFMLTRGAPGMELLRADLLARLEASSERRPSDEMIDELLAIRPEYLEAMFDALAREHGSVDGFLDSIGLDAERRTRWRESMLQ